MTLSSSGNLNFPRLRSVFSSLFFSSSSANSQHQTREFQIRKDRQTDSMLSRAPRAVLSSLRPALRGSRSPAITSSYLQHQHHQHHQQSQQPTQARIFRQGFHSSPSVRKGIHPESEEPPSPKPQSHNVAGAAVHITEPTPLTDQEYYDYSEHYLNTLMAEVEKVAEEGSELEAEYSVCFLTREREIRKGRKS